MRVCHGQINKQKTENSYYVPLYFIVAWHGPMSDSMVYYHKHSKFLCLNFTWGSIFIFLLGTFYWYLQFLPQSTSIRSTENAKALWKMLYRVLGMWESYGNALGIVFFVVDANKLNLRKVKPQLIRGHLFEIIRTSWSWIVEEIHSSKLWIDLQVESQYHRYK